LLDVAAVLLVFTYALRRWRMLSPFGASVLMLAAGTLLLFGIASEQLPLSWSAGATLAVTVVGAAIALGMYRRHEFLRSRAFG